MTLSEAQELHGPAWAAIQDRIREVATASCADFLPVVADVVEHNGQQVLRVICLTNDLPSEAGKDTSAMAFDAPLDAKPTHELVH